jgi:hypothetical protein
VPQVLRTFAKEARRRICAENGGYRRDHLRALAHRVEVNAKEVRIMGCVPSIERQLGGGSPLSSLMTAKD